MTIFPQSRFSALASYILAMILGFALFVAVYPDPFSFLAGNSVYFEVGDAPQHVSGWLLYAKDSWRWPLLANHLIAPPKGSNVALTDSIPLAALIFKPLFPFLPSDFHYFGMWHLLTKALQAAGAVFLIRSLGHRSILAGLFAAALALLWPAMLSRLHHTALMTHGVLLFALGFYFRSLSQRWSLWRLCSLFTVLLVATLLIHPYLFAMVFALFLATVWDRWGVRARWPNMLFAVGIVGLFVAGIALILGYGSAAGVSGELGYGTFSMNVLSPFCGGSLTPCPAPDATGGQYEGFNYFGLGGLLILIAGAALALRTPLTVLSWVRGHAGLSIVLLGLTLYALSSNIYMGSTELVSLDVPFPLDILTSAFRASGRFFWPVGYALIFLALAVVLRQRLAVVLALLPIAILLQWQDTDRLRGDVHTLLNMPPPFDYSGWSTMKDRIERIELTPEYGCDLQLENMRYVYFQVVAARLGIPINTAYQARYSARCEDSIARTEAMTPGVLWVDLNPQPTATPELQARLDQGSCWRWTSWVGMVLCLDGSTQTDWTGLIEP